MILVKRETSFFFNLLYFGVLIFAALSLLGCGTDMKLNSSTDTSKQSTTNKEVNVSASEQYFIAQTKVHGHTYVVQKSSSIGREAELEIFDSSRNVAFELNPCSDVQEKLKPGDSIIATSNTKPPSEFSNEVKAMNLMCYVNLIKTD